MQFSGSWHGLALYKDGDMAELSTIFEISLNTCCNAARCHLFMGLGRRASKKTICVVYKTVGYVKVCSPWMFPSLDLNLAGCGE